MTGSHASALRRLGDGTGARHRLAPVRSTLRLPPASSLLPRGLPSDPARPDLPRFAAPARRVRHQVRDGAVVVAFSAAASTGLALALLLVVSLAS